MALTSVPPALRLGRPALVVAHDLFWQFQWKLLPRFRYQRGQFFLHQASLGSKGQSIRSR